VVFIENMPRLGMKNVLVTEYNIGAIIIIAPAVYAIIKLLIGIVSSVLTASLLRRMLIKV